MRSLALPQFLLACGLLAACGTARSGRRAWPGTWAMQLDGLERQGATDALVDSPYGLLVIEATRTVQGLERFPTRELVLRLHARGKLCFAYLNVGQAERYRPYWTKKWRAPDGETGAHGRPAFLLALDPDGWAGNYPVAYWDPAWRACVLSLVDAALDDGFDGVYLDWVLGFEHPPVVAAARAAGVDPANEMVDLIRAVRQRGRARQRGFRVVAQNGAPLATARPALLSVVDAISQESIWYGGTAGAKWRDSDAGDRATPATGDWSTETLVQQLRTARDAGLPVLTIDYALAASHAASVKKKSRALGFTPFVSRSPLDRLPYGAR